ncbi:MAG: cytochrome-c peroxidase [Acidobacteriota bacterium]|nr:MAG: cytochrome-c peroxidase [Acidobacteriota bacterium]
MNLKTLSSIGLVLFGVLFSASWLSCQNTESASSRLRAQILEQFPAQLADVPVPANNRQTPDKIRLGEALFFDPNLSSCGQVACATCHIPEMGFSDGLRISKGCDGETGRRNSNTIYNTAYLSHLFWDGRAQSLEEQALGPVVDPDEMANSWENVISYLKTGTHPLTQLEYPESAQFYERYFEGVFAGEITPGNVTKAIAAYERSIVSRDAPYDRWIQGDDSALSREALKGARVFFGRGRCSECHQPPNFTDSDFHNVAVQRAGFEKPEMFPENDHICGGILKDVDPGRAEVAALRSSEADLGRFKTPTLRNVEQTAPYMHNGTFSTLDGVLQHYWNVGRGTMTAQIGTVDDKADMIMLTSFGGEPDDMINLMAFLKALTGSQMQSPAGGIAPPGGE